MAILETRRPYYQTVRHDLAQKIAAGTYASGSALPSIGDLSELYRTSHITISRALELLREEGLIRCRRGSRARVAEQNRRSTERRHGYRIGMLHNSVLPNGQYDYEEGPCGWLIQQYATARLIADRNPALPIPLRGDWRRHLHGVDGVLAFSLTEEVYNEFCAMRMPFMHVSYLNTRWPANVVMLDSFPAMAQMATYFIAGGVRQVLFISTLYSEALEREGRKPETFDLSLTGSWKPFFEMLQDHGLNEDRFHIMECRDFKEKLADRLVLRLAQLRQAGPIGVMTNGDLLAREAVTAARMLGLTLKKDIFITGASGLPESSSQSPALSVEQPPYRQAAELAVELLYEQIRNGTGLIPNRALPVKFVIRQT